ncbi:MAG: NUDIX hydrolase [Rubrobacteraceae bacterium]
MEDRRWRTLARKYLHRSPWFAFRLDEVSLPDGTEIEYGVLEGNEIVATLAVTDGGNVILVRQWRQPLGEMSLSLPGGAVEVGESIEAAAERELFEETGYRAEGLKRIVSVHTTPGRSDEVCHIFECRAVSDESGPRPEPTEFIEVVEMSLEEAGESVRTGKISDAASVLGISLGCR